MKSLSYYTWFMQISSFLFNRKRHSARPEAAEKLHWRYGQQLCPETQICPMSSSSVVNLMIGISRMCGACADGGLYSSAEGTAGPTSH